MSGQARTYLKPLEKRKTASFLKRRDAKILRHLKERLDKRKGEVDVNG